MARIAEKTLQFLNQLKQNNDRTWFAKNKEVYEMAKADAQSFFDALFVRMNEIDHIEAGKTYRIYRDIRFSKDKTPYKSAFNYSMRRQKPQLRGGYYLSLAAEESFIGCGFWNPSSPDLKLIRTHLAHDDQALRDIIADPEFLKTFGKLDGDAVKTAPKGFSKDHKAIDLIRMKQFLVSKKYKKKEVLSTHFMDTLIQDFKAIRPFFDYMSEILRYDQNGIAIY